MMKGKILILDFLGTCLIGFFGGNSHQLHVSNLELRRHGHFPRQNRWAKAITRVGGKSICLEFSM